MLTYHYNFSRGRCIVVAGPHRRETLSRELMYKAIREAAGIASIGVVVFTRGESTLFDQLVEGVSPANKHGFVTRLVVNAWWASSAKRAREYLGGLREAGLQVLNISFDRFHALFLAKCGGFQNVINAASVAVELGITVLIGITKLRDEEGLDIKWVKERLREAGLEGVMAIQGVPSRLGRAANLPEEIFPEDNVPKEVGCPEAMRTIVLHPNGCDSMLRLYRNVARGGVACHCRKPQ